MSAHLAVEDQVRATLSPTRRELLGLLQQPASATELARRTGMARQKINYHVRVLEDAGLVELVETRARRGCVERVLQATTTELVVDPQIVAPPSAVRSRDRYAAEHLSDAAAATVRSVTRLRAGAERRGQRLLTFTIETEVAFGQPADVHAFTQALAECVTELSARHGTTAEPSRRYRLMIGGHPAVTDDKPESESA